MTFPVMERGSIRLKGTSMPELHTLLSDLALGESPRWHAGRLWLCDWVAHEVLAVDLAGRREIIASIPSLPFCIDFLPDGRLLIIGGQQVVRREVDGSLVPYADLTGLSPHPWNEIVVDGRGNAYINNIGFDFPGGAFAPGIVALVTPDGAVRQVADGVAFPNGMAVTPDNRTLIVAESYGNRLSAFDIAPDGSLSNRRVWADLNGGYPDGICLDAEGAVWYADVPNKRCVRVREGGEMLQTVEVDRGCFACMLGGEAEWTLFMVCAAWGGAEGMEQGQRTGQVLSVEVAVPGAGWPSHG
jgi:sugar lactone lactonase YvrE